jgi:hypothetical protein
MAKVEAPKVEEAPIVETPAPAKPPAFELDGDALAKIRPKIERKPVDSLYLEEVRAAIGVDKAYGIQVPAGTKPATIINQLRKAGKQLSVHVRIFDRSADLGWVGFKVTVKEATPVAETAPEPQAETTAE